MLNSWFDKLNQVLAKGYDGLRVTGDCAYWLKKREWKDFTEYEKAVNDNISEYKMIAICSYPLDKCQVSEVIDVVGSHQGVLLKREGKWECIESADRKKIKAARKESEEKFRAIFDNAIDGILVTDIENKKFLTGNSMICQMLGYSREEIKNIGVRDIHSQEDLPWIIEQFEKQSKEKVTLAKDIPVKRKDGSVFYADINASLIDMQGKKCLIGIFRDITELKKAEEKLRRHKQLLESSQETIKEFAQRILEVREDEKKKLGSFLLNVMFFL